MELRVIPVLMFICSHTSSQIVSYFVNQSKTFDEAQKHCRDHYIDLATLAAQADVDELFAREDFAYTKSAWIGLRRAGSKKWRWALDDKAFYREGEYQYRNWAPTEDGLVEFEDCAVMAADGQFYDTYCIFDRYFVCYDAREYDNQKFIFINSPKSWGVAQRYCRQFHTDLVSVRNSSENLQIQQLIPPGLFVYIGLFRDAYVWSDNSTSAFRNWDTAQLSGLGECVVQQLQGDRRWEDQMCTAHKPFFCSALLKKRQILKIQVKSHQDVSDARVQQAISAELKQRLEELGMTYDSMEWRPQSH